MKSAVEGRRAQDMQRWTRARVCARVCWRIYRYLSAYPFSMHRQQRARVQSASIYRGGKAAAAYLVEYLPPLSTRGRCAVLIALLRRALPAIHTHTRIHSHAIYIYICTLAEKT